MRRAMNVITLLKADHKAVEELFRKFEKLEAKGAPGTRVIVQKILKELTVHANVEEQIVYPAIREELGEQGDGLVLEAIEEHLVVKRLIADLIDMSPGDERHD